MTSSTRIYVTTDFVGYHQWVNAPEEVAFLRNLHRHKFGVKVSVFVNHGDREVEFFLFKREVHALLRSKIVPQLTQDPKQSCEMMAAALGQELRNAGYSVHSVEVNEDGENGSIVEYAG